MSLGGGEDVVRYVGIGPPPMGTGSSVVSRRWAARQYMGMVSISTPGRHTDSPQRASHSW